MQDDEGSDRYDVLFEALRFRRGSLVVGWGVYLLWFVFPRMMARRMIRHAVRVRAAELYADEARAQGVPESGIAMLCEWIVR